MAVCRIKDLGLPLMNVVKFRGVPILQQLHLEERLLRTSSENWCIINDGTSAPTIVTGISGKPSELLELGSVLKDQVPVIRRFTGGGTVIVDKDTIFVTFICNKDDVPGVQPYPRSIMSWSGMLYSKMFQGIGDFQLRENDYVFGDHKFGGNAQSITKSRWLHHTSFLWDYEFGNMDYLKLPVRAPKYRLERGHMDFICRMKEYLQRSVFVEKTVKAMETSFTLRPVNLESIDEHYGSENFIPSTRVLMKQELTEAWASCLENIASSG